MFKRSVTSLLLVLVFVVGTVAASAVSAAESKPAVPAFGMIDFQKAFNESNATKRRIGELEAAVKQMNDTLDLRNSNKLLTADEFRVLSDLQAKPKATAEDIKRIGELQDLAKQRERDFMALQQKSSTTDEEKAQLRELQDRSTRSAALLKQEEEAFRNEIASKQQDILQQGSRDVQAATAAVAKDKALTVVFNRANNQGIVVVYASIDITDDVIAKLNKSK